MDWDQFVVMFISIFFEGFSRPQQGVRHILKLLIDRYRKAGGELRMKCGVKRILTEGQRATGVELDDGSTLTADTVLSSAGLVETGRMLESQPIASAMEPATGKLSFTETISVLDKPARELGIDETIVFFSNTERFNYAQSAGDVDTSSGVICMPGNFNLPEAPKDHLVRITNIANFNRWVAKERLGGTDNLVGPGPTGLSDPPSEYSRAKKEWYMRSCEDAVGHIADFREHVTLVDMFTPRTIRHYTGHEGGAVYGSPRKLRTGATGVEGLYVIGTDQGFLGIIGAALSGISMANRWVLQQAPEPAA
jgi:phytoene dehydrogenase-like protein